MNTYTTMTETINALRARGYVEDFNLKPDCIICRSLNLHPEDFNIDEFYRFEGASNPDDNSILFAISSKDGLKGILVDAYGVYAENLTEPMIKKLSISRPA